MFSNRSLQPRKLETFVLKIGWELKSVFSKTLAHPAFISKELVGNYMILRPVTEIYARYSNFISQYRPFMKQLTCGVPLDVLDCYALNFLWWLRRPVLDLQDFMHMSYL